MRKTHKRTVRFLSAAATATTAAAMIAVGAPSASAADQIVGTSGDTFTPSAITGVINVGDTITFNGLDGHNATSMAGSPAAFESPAGAASYVYTTTTAGKYTYECTFHNGMTGSFTVAAAAGGTTTPATTTTATTPPADTTATTPPADTTAPADTTPPADVAGPPAPAADDKAAAPAADDSAAPSVDGSQVSVVPQGGVQSGGGSTAGFNNGGLMALGGGLLVASFMSSRVSRRVIRKN